MWRLKQKTSGNEYGIMTWYSRNKSLKPHRLLQHNHCKLIFHVQFLRYYAFMLWCQKNSLARGLRLQSMFSTCPAGNPYMSTAIETHTEEGGLAWYWKVGMRGCMMSIRGDAWCLSDTYPTQQVVWRGVKRKDKVRILSRADMKRLGVPLPSWVLHVMLQ